MKKLFSIMLVFVLIFAVTGCGSEETGEEPTEKVTLTAAEFDELLQKQPLAVTSVEYIVQSDDYKTLYPDMLQAIIQNNTSEDIRNAVIAFAAWDENGLPLKIKGNIDFSDGSYIKEVTFDDINLVPGQTFGEGHGYSIDEDLAVDSFKAVVVSFETFDGDSWENPYFKNFCELYEEQKLNPDASTELVIVDSTFEIAENNSPAKDDTQAKKEDSKKALTPEELDSLLSAEPLTVTSTQYVIQDDTYKALYPDMLQAILLNQSDDDIKDAVVAFVAWDENGLPVKILGNMDFSDGSYIKEVSFENVNLVPGQTSDDQKGYSISDDIGISEFKAIAVSYETFEGTTWKNPHYSDFKELYEGKKLQ